MHTKYLVIGVVFVLLLGGAVGTYHVLSTNPNNEIRENSDTALRDTEDTLPVTNETGRIGGQPDPLPQVPQEDLVTETFSGTLELVDTGCFADGECFVVVDGKHVTALMGWSRDTVGRILGVEGFGDLERFIGKPVTVYAQVHADGTYTLYGSEAFYIDTGASVLPPEDGGGEPDPGVADEAKPQIVRDGCMVGGCSSQLCGEASEIDGLMSTCEYRAQYACYQVATCERQEGGACGWTMDDGLTQCLRDMESEPILEVN
jgi:hypothetical protein